VLVLNLAEAEHRVAVPRGLLASQQVLEEGRAGAEHQPVGLNGLGVARHE